MLAEAMKPIVASDDLDNDDEAFALNRQVTALKAREAADQELRIKKQDVGAARKRHRTNIAEVRADFELSQQEYAADIARKVARGKERNAEIQAIAAVATASGGVVRPRFATRVLSAPPTVAPTAYVEEDIEMLDDDGDGDDELLDDDCESNASTVTKLTNVFDKSVV
jgi:hypothetical protein